MTGPALMARVLIGSHSSQCVELKHSRNDPPETSRDTRGYTYNTTIIMYMHMWVYTYTCTPYMVHKCLHNG